MLQFSRLRFLHKAKTPQRRFYRPLFPSTKQLLSPLQDFKKDILVTPQIEIASWQIPHPEKAKDGGEDTYFISKGERMLASFGVFDGVGGWSEQGINPRDYPYQLALSCLKTATSESATSPLAILAPAYETVQEMNIVGSCTACVLCIDHKSTLTVTNLGDSGFMVIRDGNIISQSSEQQHLFNMPYQLGYESTDTPYNGDLYTVDLASGDIIMAATDGVLDNLFPAQIVDIIYQNSKESAQDIALAVAQLASTEGAKEKGRSPFAENARKIGYKVEGGKQDDVTVVIAKIIIAEFPVKQF